MDISSERPDIAMDTFGRYRVIAGLGHGGMAAVHLAVMEGPSGFSKLVVLKQILPQYADDADILGMFLDEARLAARLSHPNVVQTNEVGCEGKHHFLAMEYLDGQPLHRILHRLSRHGGLPLAMHLQVISDLLAGLHYAHELADYDGSPLGVVHCDVSPHNTFVTYDGVVKVVDFGVAKARTALTQSRAGVIKGKITYMAPEQVRSEDLDRRADVFSAGVMLWEAATGKRPWRGVPESTVMESLLAGHFPAPCSSNAGVPVELESIILKALSFDRRTRYATAAELQAAIDGYLDTVGGRLPQRELGNLLATHFAAERGVITSLIEEQLHEHASAPGNAARPRPMLEPAEGDTPGRTPSPDASAQLDASASMRSAVTHPDSSWPRITPRALASALVERAPRPGERSSSTATGPTVFETRVATTFKPRSRLFTAAAIVVAAVGAMTFLPRSMAIPAPPTAPASAPQATASAVAPAPSTVELQLLAAPPHARFFLDDAPLAGNPFRGEVAHDAGVHQIRIEAVGFVPRVQSITLDRNTLLDVELAGEVVAPPARSPSLPEAARSRSLTASRPPRAPRILYW